MKPWNSKDCDPHNDINELIEFGKKQTYHNYKDVQMRKKLFLEYLNLTGCKTKKELEQGYYERFGENIKIEIIET